MFYLLIQDRFEDCPNSTNAQSCYTYVSQFGGNNVKSYRLYTTITVSKHSHNGLCKNALMHREAGPCSSGNKFGLIKIVGMVLAGPVWHMRCLN